MAENRGRISHISPRKTRGGRAKCEFLQFRLGPDLWYTLDRGTLDGLRDSSSGVKKAQQHFIMPSSDGLKMADFATLTWNITWSGSWIWLKFWCSAKLINIHSPNFIKIGGKINHKRTSLRSYVRTERRLERFIRSSRGKKMTQLKKSIVVLKPKSFQWINSGARRMARAEWQQQQQHCSESVSYDRIVGLHERMPDFANVAGRATGCRPWWTHHACAAASHRLPVRTTRDRVNIWSAGQ